MIKLLSIEWLKIRHYATFWILAGLLGVFICLMNIGVRYGIMNVGKSQVSILSNIYSFPGVWDNVAFWTKFFTALISIIIIILTTNEYMFRTNRQNIIDGWTRMQFLHSKWLIVIVLSLFVTCYTFIEGMVFAIANGSSLSNFAGHIEKIFYVFVLCMNYFGLALTLSLFFKRSGMTIIIFLMYNYIIEVLLMKLINTHTTGDYGNFLPLQCSADLISFPFTEMIKKALNASAPSNQSLLIASIFWIVIYYLVTRLRLMKTDW